MNTDGMFTNGPTFADWTYDSPYLPEDVHVDEEKGGHWIEWLNTHPYTNEDGAYLGRRAGECVALAIGLFLHDIHKAWFSASDPDEPDDPSLPTFLQGTVLKLAWVDSILLPLCMALSACIGG